MPIVCHCHTPWPILLCFEDDGGRQCPLPRDLHTVVRTLPLLVTQTQMFNNYSALCYTAFIEGEVYGCTDSCMTEVNEAIAIVLERLTL